jgi:N-acyl-D-amino-acid deacylase
MADYDLLIENTAVIDGTGEPAVKGSVGVVGGKIAAVGNVAGRAERVIDGSGLVTCPGFVDPHSHADTTIFAYPLAENLVMQGITTFLGGNCGICPAPLKDPEAARKAMSVFDMDVDVCWRTFGEWLKAVEKNRLSVNYAPLAGHGSIRAAVLGEDFRRRSTVAETEEMKGLVDEAMREGAFGLSSFMDPSPGEFAAVDEVIELVKVAQKHGGFYTPHTRHHQNQWWADDPKEYAYGLYHGYKGEVIAGRYHGLLEAVEIARLANRIKLVIAHFTPAFIMPQPHPLYLQEATARASLELIVDKARAEGLDVYFNVIPSSQSISHETPVIDDIFSKRLALPDWLTSLSKEEFIGKLGTREFRDRLGAHIYSGRFKVGMLNPVTDPYWSFCYQIVRTKAEKLQGKTIGELARQRQPDHIIDAVYGEALEVVFDLLVADPDATWALILDKREYPGATPVFLKHPVGMPCTDVSSMPAVLPEGRKNASPIAYGLYPHYIQTFVREKAVLTLEEAIYHATFLPAQKVLGLKDRGVLAPGACADILVFNPDTIGPKGTFADPAQAPQGIECVVVNGQIVWQGGAHTGARPGKVLRRT